MQDAQRGLDDATVALDNAAADALAGVAVVVSEPKKVCGAAQVTFSGQKEVNAFEALRSSVSAARPSWAYYRRRSQVGARYQLQMFINGTPLSNHPNAALALVVLNKDTGQNQWYCNDASLHNLVVGEPSNGVLPLNLVLQAGWQSRASKAESCQGSEPGGRLFANHRFS
jgi:hypothetical protein